MIAVLIRTIALLLNVFLFVASFITGIGIFALFGHLLIDQYKAAWESGTGSKGVIAASFSIGVALSLVFLNCYSDIEQMAVIDTIWVDVVPFVREVSPISIFEAFIPQVYRELIQYLLSSLSYPLFDSFVLVTVIFFSSIGIIRGLFSPSLEDRFQVTFIGKEAALLALSPVLGVILLLFVAFLPKED